MPQQVAQAAHGINWGAGRYFGHARRADLDHGFGDPLQAAFDRIDGLFVGSESYEIHARYVAFDPGDVVCDIPQPQRLALSRHAAGPG